MASVRANTSVGTPRNIGRQTRRHQLLHRFLRRHQDLAAEVPALLGGGQLVFEMHAGGARLDHRLHQLEGVKGAAKSGFGVGNQRHEPVNTVLAFGVMDLVGANEGVVEASAKIGYRVGGIETLVGIHLAGVVGVSRNLPAANIDGLQAGGDHLHCLIAGYGAESVDILFGGQHLPQASGAETRQRMLDAECAAQAHHIFRGIRTCDPLPARVGLP